MERIFYLAFLWFSTLDGFAGKHIKGRVWTVSSCRSFNKRLINNLVTHWSVFSLLLPRIDPLRILTVRSCFSSAVCFQVASNIWGCMFVCYSWMLLYSLWHNVKLKASLLQVSFWLGTLIKISWVIPWEPMSGLILICFHYCRCIGFVDVMPSAISVRRMFAFNSTG